MDYCNLTFYLKYIYIILLQNTNDNFNDNITKTNVQDIFYSFNE